MTTLTRADLTAMGRTVVNGVAVKIAGSGETIRHSVREVVCKSTVPPSPYRSKWEAERADWWEAHMREGFIKSWRYEPLRLRLADGTYYKPDFLVEFVSSGGPEIMLEEVKGFWREAAKVRYKVARELFPMFTFNAVTKRNGLWVSAL